MHARLEELCQTETLHVLRFGQTAKWWSNTFRQKLPWLAIHFAEVQEDWRMTPGVDFISSDIFQKEVAPCTFGIYQTIGSDCVLQDCDRGGIRRAAVLVRPVEPLPQVFEVIFVAKFDPVINGTRFVAHWKSPLMEFEFNCVPDFNQKCGHNHGEVTNLSIWKVSLSTVIWTEGNCSFVGVQLVEPIVKRSKRRHGRAAYMEEPGFKSRLKPYAGTR